MTKKKVFSLFLALSLMVLAVIYSFSSGIISSSLVLSKNGTTENTTLNSFDTTRMEQATLSAVASTTRAIKHSTTMESGSVSESESVSESSSETESVKLGNDFFVNTVFVGDSVSLGLRNYVTKQRNAGIDCLGEAKFLCAGSMSYTNSLRKIGEKDSIHPIYKGKEVTVEEAIKEMGAEKVFIMLGMNDFCAYPTETGINNAKKVIEKILEKSPEAAIYVQSVTPVTKEKEYGKFNNEEIDNFNAQLKNLCEEKGWIYIDISSQLKDEDNCLRAEYCSDPDDQGIHMSATACKVWVNYLTDQF